MRFIEILDGLNTWFSTEEIDLLKKLKENDLMDEVLEERESEVLKQLISRDAVVPFTKDKKLGYRIQERFKEIEL